MLVAKAEELTCQVKDARVDSPAVERGLYQAVLLWVVLAFTCGLAVCSSVLGFCALHARVAVSVTLSLGRLYVWLCNVLIH